MKGKSKNIIRLSKGIFPFLMAALLALPYLYAARYAVISSDDVSNLLHVRHIMKNEGLGHLAASLLATRNIYMNNQGTWFSSLVEFFSLSFEAFDNVKTLHIFLLVSDAAFFFGILFFMARISDYFLQGRFLAPFYLLVFITAMSYESPSEILYWMTGDCVYTIPLAMMLIAAGLFLGYLKKQNRWEIVTACVLAALASGGNLLISGFFCAFELCIILLDYREGRKPLRGELVFFGICVLGALINTVAPGNFVRHGDFVEGGRLFIGQSLINTFLIIIDRVVKIFSEGYLLTTVIAAFAIAFVFTEKDQAYEGRLGFAGGLFGGFVCIYAALFPVVLAYNTTMDDPYLGVRIEFLTGWMISFVFTLLAFYLGMRMKRNRGGDAGIDRRIIMTAAAAIALAFIINTALLISSGHKNYIYRFCDEFVTGRLKDFYDTRFEALLQFKHSEYDSVFVTHWLTVSHIMKDIELSSDSGWWVNQVFADYYDRSEVFYSPPLEYYDTYAYEFE